MAGGVAQVTLDSVNLGLQCLDPLGKLVERQGPEVLLDERHERIVRFRGKEIVEIHSLRTLTRAGPKSISPGTEWGRK